MTFEEDPVKDASKGIGSNSSQDGNREEGLNLEQHLNLDERLNLDEDFPEEDCEDYMELSDQLDALNSALDTLEQENDRIHSALKELLEDSRQTREQLAKENKQKDSKSEQCQEKKH